MISPFKYFSRYVHCLLHLWLVSIMLHIFMAIFAWWWLHKWGYNANYYYYFRHGTCCVAISLIRSELTSNFNYVLLLWKVVGLIEAFSPISLSSDPPWPPSSVGRTAFKPGTASHAASMLEPTRSNWSATEQGKTKQRGIDLNLIQFTMKFLDRTLEYSNFLIPRNTDCILNGHKMIFL